MKKRYSLLALLLLSVFLLQYYFGLNWRWLSELQGNEVYQQLSGFFLLLFILVQWQLSLLRVRNKIHQAQNKLIQHRNIGVLAPVFFYAHSQTLGYAFVFLLSSVYLSIVLIGLLHPSIIKIRLKAYSNLWLLIHISLSALLLLLIGQHIFISYWYE